MGLASGEFPCRRFGEDAVDLAVAEAVGGDDVHKLGVGVGHHRGGGGLFNGRVIGGGVASGVVVMASFAFFVLTNRLAS